MGFGAKIHTKVYTMTTYVAVFRSKTQLMSFIQIMGRFGAVVSTTATPTKAGVGCGISASFETRHLSLARQIINEYALNSFHSIFKVTKDGFRTTTSKII